MTARTTAELRAARDGSTADMVELRLDGVRDVDVAGSLHGRRLPVIVTCRPGWEGGRFDGSEEERHRILGEALECGAEYVDIEWQAGFDDLIRRHPGRVVLSSHDFAGVPPDLAGRAHAMRATGARTIKIAAMAAALSDTLPLLDIPKDGPAVVIGMGEAGVPSRLLASRFASAWTYAGAAVAPGQLPVRCMGERFRFRRIGERTAIYGVVGNNVMHSKSPAMHNAAFEAAGLDAVYVPLRAASFDDFLTFAAALGISGASVTIPFKQDALAAAATADALAWQVGAANTVRRVGPAEAGSPDPAYVPPADAGHHHRAYVAAGFSRPMWEATNTDVEGFLDPIDADLRDLRVSVLGAGGSARAAVVGLLWRGARVTLHARRPEQAREVVSGLGGAVAAGAWPPAAGSWDVLVNCTPLGSASARDASPLPGGPFDGRLVYDLTYGDGESPLLREARQAGCAVLDGLPMLVAQAERQFAWWTGQRPAAGVMRRAAEEDSCI